MATASHSKTTGKSGKAPAAAKTAGARKAVDAVTLLKQDHREVEDMFAKFETARSENVKADLAEKICMALKVHTQIEEELFYPPAHEMLEEEIVDEAIVEHDGAKKLIAEIEAMGPDDHLFDAKVKVLSEMIDHHVQEEEKEMFPQARKSDMDLDAIGEQMAARKAELMGRFRGNGRS